MCISGYTLLPLDYTRSKKLGLYSWARWRGENLNTVCHSEGVAQCMNTQNTSTWVLFRWFVPKSHAATIFHIWIAVIIIVHWRWYMNPDTETHNPKHSWALPGYPRVIVLVSRIWSHDIKVSFWWRANRKKRRYEIDAGPDSTTKPTTHPATKK